MPEFISLKITKYKANIFRQGLYAWALKHPRPMPWKGEKDPYKIWLSEIILQQTRVEQGWPYFENFIRRFPTIHHLARASTEQVLKLWEGLGYYTRARNLHHTAIYISKDLRGQFPDEYDKIKQLKGIGDYTAAAIASFAYDQPYAVLDGNVHRILSRYFGISSLMQSNDQKKYFQLISQQLIDHSASGRYNQAIMDFGATCCTPSKPRCAECPLRRSCYALKHQKVDQLPPAKINKLKRSRHFHYFIVVKDDQLAAINPRSKGDIWTGLFEFPMIETESALFPLDTEHLVLQQLIKNPITPILIAKQTLTHQVIHGYFYLCKIKTMAKKMNYIPVKTLTALPMPGIIAKNRIELLNIINKYT